MKRLATVALILVFALSLSAKDGKFRKTEKKVPDQYIVVFDDAVSDEEIDALSDDLSRKHAGLREYVYTSAVKGFSVKMSEGMAKKLSEDDRIAWVEEDGEVELIATQSNPPWGLDRIDQRSRPLSGTFTYTRTGSGVRAYVIDTGIRPTHTQFGGRASVAYDALGGNGLDCNGHGTHVAGTIGGSTYGVAKSVQLRGVRVLNCSGSGTWSQIIAGIDWVRRNHVKPAVANMSLGGGANSSVDTAVNNLVNAGVTVVVAAGNSNANACNYSPARVGGAITVGSTTSSDARSSFSNYGSCLDLFAPGSSIASAWHTSDTATNTISGTSMASPHVAGVAALYLQGSTTASPATVRNALVNNATAGVVTSAGTGSPNRLLFTNY
jgi:subtilisin family serine protease